MLTSKKHVTRFLLYRKGACRHGRRVFKETFGYRAEISLENMKKAIETFPCGDVQFYVMYLAPRKQRPLLKKLYTQAQEEREAVLKERWLRLEDF